MREEGPRLMTAPPLLTVMQAAARLNVSASTVRSLVRHHRISHVRVGEGTAKSRIRFAEADIDAYIARNRRAAAGEEQAPVRVGPRRVARRSLRDLPEAARYAH